jgi:hypothetical protein
MTGEKPDLSRARKFGCRIWVRVHGGSKLDKRGVEAKWVGPSMETPDSHKVYWPQKGTVTVERNVRFDGETDFAGEKDESNVSVLSSEEKEKTAQKGSARTSEPNTTSTPPPPASPECPTPQGEIPRLPSTRPTTPLSETPTFMADDIAQDNLDSDTASEAASDVGEQPSRRIRKPSEYVHPLQGGEGITGGARKYARGLQVPDENAKPHASVVYAAAIIPRSFRHAQRSEIWPEWEAAMETEVTTLDSHKTYSIVTRDKARNSPVLPLKWVY